MKKLLMFLVPVSLLFGVITNTFAGGGGQSTPSTTTGEKIPVTTGGTLIIGEYILDTQLAAKNPLFPSNTAIGILNFIYERLMYFNSITGVLEPQIATGYEWSGDFRTLTFTIRDNIKWHDGQPLTADDVVFSYTILKNYPVTDNYSLWSKISSVTSQGNKVIFQLSQDFPSLPFYTDDVYILPKHIWEGISNITEFLNPTPVGSGPFTWGSYTVGTEVQLKAYKDYWAGAPKVDNFIIKLYNTSPNATLGLLRQDIYATMGTIAVANTPEFLSKPNAKMQLFAGLTNWLVFFNLENELLADVNVRKAMCMAINPTELDARTNYGTAFPVSIGFLPFLFGDLISEKAKEPFVTDPAGAIKLLEDSGYTRGSDGIFQKNGKRLSFTYHNASGAPGQQMQAGMIQQWLLNIGIEIIPRLATWPELTALAQRGNYDLLQNSISFPPDPYAALNTTFNSSMTAPKGTNVVGTNYMRYRNPKVDALLDEVASVVDPAKQKEIYTQIQDIIIDDCPFIPMYNTGGHIPYYDGGRYMGWLDDIPIFANRSIINVYEVK
ncbi:MAG: peptide ABC transporter substrate-binding protein [Treponema sp.]|nr:peptide ABC transporter substrate-binding protein [Treponema sp.]